jgi:hypothetical protein
MIHWLYVLYLSIQVPIPVQRWCKVELIGLNQERKSLVHGVECHSFFYQLGHQAEVKLGNGVDM